MRSIIAAALALVAVNASALAEETDSASIVETAEAYLAAYSDFDLDKMAALYADDVVFSDPTSKGMLDGGGAFIYEGKDAALKGLRDYADQYGAFSLRYDLERRYESAGFVVFIGYLAFQGRDKQGDAFTGGSPIVTVIEVRDGKVAKHIDYYDYRQNAVDF